MIRKHDKLFRFSSDEESKIVNNYINDNLSITKISKIYSVDRDTISRLLLRYNVTIRPLGRHLRKFPLNESYFDVIDTEDKAYFLGLLYADGCNHFNDRKKKITISLQENDQDILVKFSKLLYNGNEFLQHVKSRNGGKAQKTLSIHSAKISKRLNDLGCVPQKSLILKFPEWLTDLELQRHFIRGYFDGDGSLSKYERNNGYDYQCSIISTEDFCSKITSIIESTLKIHVCDKITVPNSNNFITTTIYVRGKFQILKFMNWLYEGSTIYLDRKYQKYLELKSYAESTTHDIKERKTNISAYYQQIHSVEP